MQDAFDEQLQRRTLVAIPGGQRLLDWRGGTPEFGDAEIARLDLMAAGRSLMALRYWPRQSQDERRLVAFHIDEIVDLELDGFGPQNVCGHLWIRPAPDRPDRTPLFGTRPPGDLEFAFETLYGMGGRFRCAGVTISLHPDSDGRLLK